MQVGTTAPQLLPNQVVQAFAFCADDLYAAPGERKPSDWSLGAGE